MCVCVCFFHFNVRHAFNLYHQAKAKSMKPNNKSFHWKVNSRQSILGQNMYMYTVHVFGYMFSCTSVLYCTPYGTRYTVKHQSITVDWNMLSWRQHSKLVSHSNIVQLQYICNTFTIERQIDLKFFKNRKKKEKEEARNKKQQNQESRTRTKLNSTKKKKE